MIRLLLSALFSAPVGASAQTLLAEDFSRPAAAWEAMSGEITRKVGTGWTNSPSLRMLSRRADLKDIAVKFDLIMRGMTPGHSAGAQASDGLHIWLLYKSEASYYEVSVNRRDETILIQKKQGGELHTLSGPAGFPVQFNSWQEVHAAISDNMYGSVTIAL